MPVRSMLFDKLRCKDLISVRARKQNYVHVSIGILQSIPCALSTLVWVYMYVLRGTEITLASDLVLLVCADLESRVVYFGLQTPSFFDLPLVSVLQNEGIGASECHEDF